MNRVVLITTNIAPYRLRWCEELAEYYDVTIYHSKEKEKDYNDSFLKHSSDRCRICRMKNNRNDGLDPICFDVIKVLKENRDSFIIFDGYGPKTNLLGMLYCRMHGIGFFVNVDGFPTERKKSFFRNLVRRLVIGGLCTSFFCSGQRTKDYLIGYGAKPDKVHIHNFSSVTGDRILSKPLNHEEKEKIRKRLGILCLGKLVLGVGRFIPLKRFEDLIRAVLQCKSECDLLLLGGKPTDEYLNISKDSSRIHYVDFVLPEEVDDYYRAADLFVLPSETDVWGLVLNEAMAQGLPVISSDSPVGAYSLIEGNGMIYPTYDIEALSKDIERCLKENEDLSLSERSLEIIRNYTIEGMVQRQKPVIDQYFDLQK